MRVGIDVGGTFTDFVLLEDASGRIATHKCLTTPRDPSQAFLEGLRALERAHPGCLARLEEVIHGTTLVVNAIIERKGARTGLLTTQGFRDVLELGREIRYAAYDVFAEFPEPLVPRERRLEVRERLRADGSVLEPLDRTGAREAIRALKGLQVQSVAVCLLNSFENPAHELELKRLLAEEFPEASVSVSCEVLPQIREYERTSTTVANAYVKPLTESYLARLEARLADAGFRGRLFIMLSSGGVTSAPTAAEFPVRIIESGPTAAVIAGQYYSRLFGVPEMLCFDMGGTTAKSCLIQGGEAGVVQSFEVGRVQRFQKGSGLAIQVPVVDLMEIGAGGEPFHTVLIRGGGMGAGAMRDGAGSFIFPANGANTPVEILESDSPLIVERRELLPDSGGAGRQRGALGRREVFRVPDDAHAPQPPVHLGIQSGRFRLPPEGLFGGKPGARARFLVNGVPGNPYGLTRLKPGDVVVMDAAGGGGYGDPRERDREALERDLREGKVSPEAARTVYRMESE